MRYEIFKTLKDTDGFVSGQTLSTSLGATRAALWKHIKAMQTDGATIDSVSSKGYRLVSPPNVPRAEYVQAYLRAHARVVYQQSVTSTNDVAKLAAQDKNVTNTVFIAGEQTAGKGRKGRMWQSPIDEGIYMSFLVRPQMDAEKVSGITLMAALALCDAIEKVSAIKVGIKWPNDVLIDGKKVSGILTESMLGMDGIEYIVCGMGINVDQKCFDEELKDKACALGMRAPINKTLLTAAIIDGFFENYQTFLKQGLWAFMPAFRARSAIKGQVTIISPASTDTGTLVGYDDTGAILIDCGGTQKRYVAGEVSLRGEKGYV